MRKRARLKHMLSNGAAVAALFAAGAAMGGQNAIKIGVMIDGSGFAQDTGGVGAVTAAEMAAADYGGKALGKPVQIVSADMQNKPDIASSIARQWFDQDQVDAITDLPVSSVGLAVQQIGKEKHKVLLISAAATTELTGAQCSPYSIQWADDTAALANGTARAVVANGGKKWFFITADFAFGTAMEGAASTVIKASGGEVVGDIKHPLGTTDFSSYLLKAQSSGANVVGLANVGLDSIATIRQAGEFGLTQGGQQLAGFIVFISDIHTLGLKTAQGTYVTTGYYWDDSDGTRAFAKRFFDKRQRMPTKEQANTYAAVLHYLKAIDAAKTDDAEKVTAQMKSMPTDYFGRKGSIREDGRVLYDLALYQVKKPEESKYPWDYYKKIRDIPAGEAFRPLADGNCPFVKKN
ncbi:MAG TPA: ABC transporter substrate-binding protein [Aliidongia sp.]|uniref:ABC transporter substrate-binding protein n=1 Tax=Aliidongia sp. TaxID=1914230 RepID=UPI002DDD7B69|nr:ABC transporter substrate-binding protein [Aliidongia sp.]HEV2674070.1 ABC transporter substrate-binding protein [Aliidongia sp.]